MMDYSDEAVVLACLQRHGIPAIKSHKRDDVAGIDAWLGDASARHIFHPASIKAQRRAKETGNFSFELELQAFGQWFPGNWAKESQVCEYLAIFDGLTVEVYPVEAIIGYIEANGFDRVAHLGKRAREHNRTVGLRVTNALNGLIARKKLEPLAVFRGEVAEDDFNHKIEEFFDSGDRGCDFDDEDDGND